jgi:DNA-directed RNA polymerase specialized sigma24 family protein
VKLNKNTRKEKIKEELWQFAESLLHSEESVEDLIEEFFARLEGRVGGKRDNYEEI